MRDSISHNKQSNLPIVPSKTYSSESFSSFIHEMKRKERKKNKVKKLKRNE